MAKISREGVLGAGVGVLGIGVGAALQYPEALGITDEFETFLAWALAALIAVGLMLIVLAFVPRREPKDLRTSRHESLGSTLVRQRAERASMAAELDKHRYWLSVAESYGDELRASKLRADVAIIKHRLGALDQQIIGNEKAQIAIKR